MDPNAKTPEPGVANVSGIVDSEPTAPLDPAEMMTEALAWVEKNQTLAMLGAFALGVFIGALMRD